MFHLLFDCGVTRYRLTTGFGCSRTVSALAVEGSGSGPREIQIATDGGVTDAAAGGAVDTSSCETGRPTRI